MRQTFKVRNSIELEYLLDELKKLGYTNINRNYNVVPCSLVIDTETRTATAIELEGGMRVRTGELLHLADSKHAVYQWEKPNPTNKFVEISQKEALTLIMMGGKVYSREGDGLKLIRPSQTTIEKFLNVKEFYVYETEVD